MNSSQPEMLLAPLRSVRAPAELLQDVLRTLELGCRYARYDTLVGPVQVAYGKAGVLAVRLGDDPAEFESWFQRRFRRCAIQVPELPRRVAAELRKALHSRNPHPAVDLSVLTPFERAVLQKTLEIPRGEVRTYSWVAKEIGRPRAVRAVGSALAGNPIPLVIPCHRVVRSDGHIGEYGCGGPDAKKLVLAEEGADPAGLERLARRGIRLVGSDTTHAYCLPSCRGAKRITERHLVLFKSEAQALSAGYHPCNVCRPAGAAA